MKTIQIILINIITLIWLSCESKHEFNSAVWKQKGVDWRLTDVREKMVDDLINSDSLIGLNAPEYISNLYLKLDMAGQVIKYEVRK